MFGRKRESILAIKVSGLLGFVNAEPALAALREARPKARITLLTSPEIARLAKEAPHFDRVVALPEFRNRPARRAFYKQLRTGKFRRVFDFDNTPDSRRFIGSYKPFKPKCMRPDPDLPLEQAYEAMVQGEPPLRAPNLRWAFDSRKDAANMLPSWYGLSGPFALLTPAADGAPRWPSERYAELAAECARRGVTPVLIGLGERRIVGQAVARAAPALLNLAGKADLLQIAALAREAAFFIGDDADCAHYLASLGCAGVFLASTQPGEGGAPATEPLAPRGRAVVAVTAPALSDVGIETAVRTLGNMGLAPEHGAYAPIETGGRPVASGQAYAPVRAPAQAPAPEPANAASGDTPSPLRKPERTPPGAKRRAFMS